MSESARRLCMVYNLNTAAVAMGVHPTTVLRAIKAGKLSAERNERGAWMIQPAELRRVFAPLPQLPAEAAPMQTYRPEDNVAAYSIRAFCLAHSISPAFYYKLQKQGIGPRELRLGARTLISAESAAEWRRERELASRQKMQSV